MSLLTSHLSLGTVELNVKDLTLQKQFYHELVGLEILSESSEKVGLGFGQSELVRLISTPDLPLFEDHNAGLYHTAILFEQRPALARTLQYIFEHAPQYFSGSSDHIVSEAFYFSDPEGNGLELYADRDSSGWVWHDGKIMMGSSYIDPAEYIAQHAGTESSESKTIGHVHLQVGNIAEAKKFYVDVLGFSTTAEMPTALFISDGEYHHHLGMNTWQSEGAGKRPTSTGLSHFEVKLSNIEDGVELKKRLTAAGISFEETNNRIAVRDPWNTVLSFVAQQ